MSKGWTPSKHSSCFIDCSLLVFSFYLACGGMYVSKHGNKRPNKSTKTLSNHHHRTSQEVSEAIRASAPNKAPGPDGIPIELYKFLDEDNVKTLARILNQMWTEESYPTDFTCAEVVSIFKKGDTALPQNYRPISLLNSSYKIFTEILQKRIAEATDQYISNTQFGFRRSRSTAEPFFCVRRLQDLGEAGHENIILIFLDWEKAFDKVNPTKLIETLENWQKNDWQHSSTL